MLRSLPRIRLRKISSCSTFHYRVGTTLPISLFCVILSFCAAIQANDISPPERELHIARLIFQPQPWSGLGPGRPWWAIDWPEAEFHFIAGIKRYTNIDVAADSKHLKLTDDAIFDYPWLFVQQVGRWQLNTLEKTRLREYLARGGFLVVDDFHGPNQWQNFMQGIEAALKSPRIKNQNPVDIPADDQLMRVLYDLNQNVQIPGRRHLQLDGTARMPHQPSRWRGIYDTHGRLVVVINFNMDMGDAWEHADDPYYPVPMTSIAYQFGINYLIYAMTH